MSELKNYRPEIYGILAAVGILNLWYLSGVAINEEIIPKNYEHLLRLVTVLIGGFIGAFSAFGLKRLEEQSKSKAQRKTTLNLSLFILTRQMNAIAAIKIDFDRCKNPFDQAFNLPALKPPNYAELKQNIESLSFLIDKDCPQLLMDITLEQERFEQALHAIELRNDFYVNEVQPSIAHHSLNRRDVTLEKFKEKLGERLYEGALHSAENMYSLVNLSNDTLPKYFGRLKEFAKQQFPGTKFIDWET